MNTFVNRFSTTGPISELRKARALAEEYEQFSDAMWGSEAGFGSLAKGVPTFSVPDVPDVSNICWITYTRLCLLTNVFCSLRLF
jgi:20S proteasome subunit beta 5